MLSAGGSWAVAYRDGSVYQMYNEHGEEQPWLAINWPEVTELAFVSVDAEGSFEFAHPGPEYEVRLGARTVQLPDDDQQPGALGAVRCWLVVTHLAGTPISQDSVVNAFFWFPDGTHHTCDDFNCPQVSRYLHELLVTAPEGRTPLAQSHAHLAVGASAVVA